MKHNFFLFSLIAFFLACVCFQPILKGENFSQQSLEETFSKPEPKSKKRKLKVLVLIIASDDLPVYIELQEIWKSYMHLDRKHVEAYFIRADPDLQRPYEVHGDTIWCKCEENLIPGVLDKTLLSMEAMLPQIQEKFDYVLRTNLSSFYVFPRLLHFLKTLPKEKCCCAVRWTHFGILFPQGAGIIFSPDYVELLLRKQNLLNRHSATDDIVIGELFEEEKIKIIPAPRLMFQSLGDYLKIKDKIPTDNFHFRVKNSSPELRLSDDIFIHKELLKTFYQIELGN